MAALVGLFCVDAGAQQGGLPQAPAPQGRLVGTISGVVKDVTGAMVPGAHVRLVTATSADTEAVTDSAGGVRLGFWCSPLMRQVLRMNGPPGRLGWVEESRSLHFAALRSR